MRGNIMASKWWIDLTLKVTALGQRTETFTKLVWWWRQKYQRKSTMKTRTYTETRTYDLSDIISEVIATNIQANMIEYAPIDESPNRDNIVLKENIEVKKNKNWQYTVGSNLPYATRRNYENRKNPDTLHYVERAYENHESEYDIIARDIAHEYVDTYIWNIIAELWRSSWAKKSTNWGSESFRL